MLTSSRFSVSNAAKATLSAPHTVRLFHVSLATLPIFLGIATFGLGFWLHWQASSPHIVHILLAFLQVNIICQFVGSILIICFFLALLSMRQDGLGLISRVFYVMLSVMSLLFLVSICYVTLLLANVGDSPDFYVHMIKIWKQVAQNEPRLACAVEVYLKCRGFADEDCRRCRFGMEWSCYAKKSYLFTVQAYFCS